MKKKCGRCKLDKPLDEFNKCKNGTFGVHGHCRSCQKQVKRTWYLENREKEIQKGRDFYNTEQGRIAIKERYKKRYETNKAKILKANRIRRNTPDARKKANIARSKLFHSNMSFRLSVNLRTRIRKTLIGINKSQTTLKFLGCTLEEFKRHLESLFKTGMTWDNYGYKGWHIDHIIPCSSFDLKDPAQQAKCFHYTNLQPLWRFDNQSKGSRI